MSNAREIESAAEGRRRRLSAKRGDTPESKLKGPSKQMEESMSEKELEKMASTKRKGKAKHSG